MAQNVKKNFNGLAAVIRSCRPVAILNQDFAHGQQAEWELTRERIADYCERRAGDSFDRIAWIARTNH